MASTLLENREKEPPKIALMDIPPSKRNPHFHKLSPRNQIFELFWLLEIQDYEKYPITYEEFIKIYKKIRNNEATSNLELKKFQAGITKFKYDDRIWSKTQEVWQKNKPWDELTIEEKLIVLESKRVLLNALTRISTNNNLLGIISKKNSKTKLNEYENTFKKLEEIIKKTSRNYQGNDNRANKSLRQNIWYMEQMNLGYSETNIIFDIIQKTELFYRSKERKTEESPTRAGAKELSFNHLLRVQRIAWGLFDKLKNNNFAGLSAKDKEQAEKLQDPKELLKLSLIALGHDLLEDGKFENPAKLRGFIIDIAQKYLPENEATEVANDVVKSINRLNTKNYINQDGTRNYEVYANGSTVEKVNVPPLTFMEKLVKFADISHNYQTRVKTADDIKITDDMSEELKKKLKLKKKELETKIPVYMKFIEENLYFAELLPWKITNKMVAQNKALLKYPAWQNLLNVHKAKPIPELEELR